MFILINTRTKACNAIVAHMFYIQNTFKIKVFYMSSYVCCFEDVVFRIKLVEINKNNIFLDFKHRIRVLMVDPRNSDDGYVLELFLLGF